MGEITVLVLLKPKVDVQAPPGANGLGELIRGLVKAARVLDYKERLAAMEAAQAALIEAGLPGEVVCSISGEIIEAVSLSGNKAKIPHEHRLTIRSQET